MFYICLSVRTLLCRRQALPQICTLFCLVLIKYIAFILTSCVCVVLIFFKIKQKTKQKTLKQIFNGSILYTLHAAGWGTTPSYTTTTSAFWRFQFNTTALVGGLVGAVIFLLFLIGMCRLCYRRAVNNSRPAGSAPYQATPSSSGPASGSGPAHHHHHHNNTVFTLSGSGNYGPSAPYDGLANMGFSSHGEAPPSYESLQPYNGAATTTQPIAPPPYSEVIMMSPGPPVAASPKPE